MNIYSIKAYDDGTCGGEQQQLCAYDSIEANARAVVSILLKDYVSAVSVNGTYEPKPYAKGAVIGHKAYGINARYATDPNWGNSIATLMAQFDTALGGQDRAQSYRIGFYENIDDEMTSFTEDNKVFTTAHQMRKRPVTIVGEEGMYYKVYNDYVLPVTVNGVLQRGEAPQYVYVRKANIRVGEHVTPYE